MNWDWVISAAIILALILGFWAKITRQTIPEIFVGIKEAIQGTAEDGMESAYEVIE